MREIYGLYNLKDNEQCEFFGTINEISAYANIPRGTIWSYLCRKRKGKQKTLRRKYEMIEMEEE